MIGNNEIVKLIFAFKIKHLRQSQGKSYQEVANQTGLSTSYLNDIEKGKKYPKPDKIALLAKVFEVEYDELISTKASKKLQPIVELLDSDFFKFFPLDEFGISLDKLVDVFASSPDKISAFISTILKVVRSYQIQQEEFYRVALRSYQDIHDNYFPSIEQMVMAFRKENRLTKTVPSFDELQKVLTEKYDVTINNKKLSAHKKLRGIRSFYSADKRKLFINEELSTPQISFILAKELGFHYLRLEERPYSTALNNEASFENLLSNFKASYFAAALLIPEQEIVKDIQVMARSIHWKSSLISKLLEKYQATPEMLLQRLTNILPHHFGLSDLFFVKLEGTSDLIKYDMTKELHLSRLHSPYHTELDEHLCHRWLSIGGIKRVSTSGEDLRIDSQVSNYWQTTNSYFCITVSQPANFFSEQASSVTLGLLMTEKLQATFNFLKDESIQQKTVHTTCERCSMADCDSRVAVAREIDKQNRELDLQKELSDLE